MSFENKSEKFILCGFGVLYNFLLVFMFYRIIIEESMKDIKVLGCTGVVLASCWFILYIKSNIQHLKSKRSVKNE